MSQNAVRGNFEHGFTSQSLSDQVRTCERHELVRDILQLFRDHQPVLEAGCGSGKWMHFLKRNGISAVGLDWSDQLSGLSRQTDASIQYDVGDMRHMPYGDCSFGAVLALGSIEHVIEGPQGILSELYRVLRPGGIGVITVPYNSICRRVTALMRDPLIALSRWNIVRGLFHKPPITRCEQELTTYRAGTRMDLIPYNGILSFYQYQYTEPQFHQELETAGLRVSRLWAIGLEDGIYHNFGRIAAQYFPSQSLFRFTGVGQCLSRMLTAKQCGHMLAAIVHRS